MAHNVDKERERRQLAEDKAAADQRQKLPCDPLTWAVKLIRLEEAIYQHSIGEKNTLKYILMDKQFKVLAFPDILPMNAGTYITEKRVTKLTLCHYF